MAELKAFLISLESSAARRTSTMEKLSALPFNIEWMKGVDGRRLKPVQRRLVSQFLAVLKYNRPLFPGEIGCALAHIKVLEEFVRSEADFGLVFEDDVAISADLPELLAGLWHQLPDDWGVVNLAHDLATPVPVKRLEAVS